MRLSIEKKLEIMLKYEKLSGWHVGENEKLVLKKIEYGYIVDSNLGVVGDEVTSWTMDFIDHCACKSKSEAVEAYRKYINHPSYEEMLLKLEIVGVM